MPKVSDVIVHILFHVNAEDSGMLDSSQVPGVAARATKVRDMLAPFENNQSNLTRKQLLIELKKTTDVEIKARLDLMDEDDDGERIRFVLSEWVGKNE